MENTPLITVITVTYNAGKVIEKTLKSLASQSFQDFEYLVIDGHSQDDTLTKIIEYNLGQTNILSEPDKGLYDAMNKGLRLSKGKYIIFLNAGDTFHTSETLKLYSKYAEEDKDIIYGDTEIVDINGNFVRPRHLTAPQKLSKKSFSKGMLICHQAFMVKKDLAPQYNTLYKYSSDYDWCIKCISNSDSTKYVNLNQVTINYLQDGLTDKNKWASLRERFRIMWRHYGSFKTIINHLSFIIRAINRGKL